MSSLGAFETPRAAYRTREQQLRDEEVVARSSAILADRDTNVVNHEEDLRKSIFDFLRKVRVDPSKDDAVTRTLHFIMANGTTYVRDRTDGGQCSLDDGIELASFALSRPCFGVGQIFVEANTSAFGCISFVDSTNDWQFFPLSGIFDNLHKKGIHSHPIGENVRYFKVVGWDENFFSRGPFGDDLCMSSQYCSDVCRYEIYKQHDLRRILDDEWLIIERWVNTNDQLTYQVPLLFSSEGQRFNYIDQKSRHELRKHLKHNAEDVTFDLWAKMKKTDIHVSPLVRHWRNFSLDLLISMKDNFSDFSEGLFNLRLFEIAVACPITVEGPVFQPVLEELKNPPLWKIMEEKRTQVNLTPPTLSGGFLAKVCELNSLLEKEGELLSAKPKFLQEEEFDPLCDRQEDFDHQHSRYETHKLQNMIAEVKQFLKELNYEFDGVCFGPRSRESRFGKIAIIMELFQTTSWADEHDLYGHFKDKESPQIDRRRFDCRHDPGRVIDELCESDHTDVDSEILRGLYLNLKFYMKTLIDMPKMQNLANTEKWNEWIWQKLTGYEEL